MGMIDKAFELAVVFSAVDRLTGPIDKMASKLGLLDKRSADTIKRLNEFKNMAFIGGGITVAGLMMARMIDQGVNEAAKLSSQWIIIKDVTGASADNMERMHRAAVAASGVTRFGQEVTTSMAQQMATGGMQTKQIIDLLPLFAKFAEVQTVGKNSTPEAATLQGMSIAHMFGKYDTKSMSKLLNMYNAATFMSPANSAEFFDTLKYLVPRTQALHMTVKDTFFTAALANRVGILGSMGGTESSNLLLNTIPGLRGGMMSSRQTQGLQALGLTNTVFDKNGNFLGMENFITRLNTAAKKLNHKELALDLAKAFGREGMGLAAILSDPRGLEQLKILEAQFREMKTIDQFQKTLNANYKGQMKQLASNLHSIALDVFGKMGDELAVILRMINPIVDALLKFEEAHPWISWVIGGFGLLATTALLVVGPIITIRGVLGYFKNAKTIATSIEMISRAFKDTAVTSDAAAGGMTAANTSAVGLLGTLTALLPVLTALAAFGGAWFLENKAEQSLDTIKQKNKTILENWPVNDKYKPITETELAQKKLFHPDIKFQERTSLGAAPIGSNFLKFNSSGKNSGSHTTIIQKGAININAQPHHSESKIADHVIKKLGAKGRQQSYSRPNQPVTMY